MDSLKHFKPALQIVSDCTAHGKDKYIANMVINLPNQYYINGLPHVNVTNGVAGAVDVEITLRTTLLTTPLGNNTNLIFRSASFEVPSGSHGTVTACLYYDDNGTKKAKSKAKYKEI